MKYDKIVNVVISEELREMWKQDAYKNMMSMSAYVRELIIKNHEVEKGKEEK